MAPERRIALVSVCAAVVLIAIKLVAGLASGSLGLLSEAAHSGRISPRAPDVLRGGVAVRRPTGPSTGTARRSTGRARGRAFLALASVAIGIVAIRLTGAAEHEVDPTWWVFAVVALVIVIDASRAVVSWRGARRYDNAALATNALTSRAISAGRPPCSSAWASPAPATRGRTRSPPSSSPVSYSPRPSHSCARTSTSSWIERRSTRMRERGGRSRRSGPRSSLRRLRMRRAAGRHFADVVIGVPPASAVGQGHAAADAVEEAVERALPGTDVVVHVEPRAEDAALRERALAAALRVPQVREIHNVAVLRVGDRTQISFHLKLPGSLPLGEAHDVASAVEAAIGAELARGLRSPHAPRASRRGDGREPARGRGVGREHDGVRRVVHEVTGRDPRELRLFRTDEGLVAFLTLALDPLRPLADAHAEASEIEQRIRSSHPDLADVIVHTEP